MHFEYQGFILACEFALPTFIYWYLSSTHNNIHNKML